MQSREGVSPPRRGVRQPMAPCMPWCRVYVSWRGVICSSGPPARPVARRVAGRRSCHAVAPCRAMLPCYVLLLVSPARRRFCFGRLPNARDSGRLEQAPAACRARLLPLCPRVVRAFRQFDG